MVPISDSSNLSNMFIEVTSHVIFIITQFSRFMHIKNCIEMECQETVWQLSKVEARRKGQLR